MSLHSTYEALRHLADSWGLLAMLAVFVGFSAWPFRSGAKRHNDAASMMIFRDDHNDQAR